MAKAAPLATEVERMRLLIARCSVEYEGRLGARLPEAVRLIMRKADGSVAIHSDGGAYKPLNWMMPPNRLQEDEGQWIVSNASKERLVITLAEVITDVTYELGEDPGLEKDGVEAHIQELLADDPTSLGAGYKLIRREYPTAIGPVDLLLRDEEGKVVAVEVKRRGDNAGVDQLSRYLEFLNKNKDLAPVRGMFVAEKINPQAKVLASERSILCMTVDYSSLKGDAQPELRLF